MSSAKIVGSLGLRATRRFRGGGGSVAVRDTLVGVTLERTVGQVIVALDARCTELSTEMVKRAKIVSEKIVESKSESCDVETLRAFVAEADPFRTPGILGVAIGEALWHAQVINALDGMRHDYEMVAGLLKEETNTGRTMQLYAHRDHTVLIPVDFERIEDFIPKPITYVDDAAFVGGHSAGPAMTMTPTPMGRPMRRSAWADGGQDMGQYTQAPMPPPRRFDTFAQVREAAAATMTDDGFLVAG